MSQRIIILFSICCLLSSTYGLDDEFVKEMKCIPPPKPDKVGLDMKWFASIGKTYVPIWSKFYAIRTASELLSRDARLISDFEVGPSSCLMFKGNVVSGFGREFKYNITGDANSITFLAPWSGAKTGKFSFHMTDNKSFLLGVTCWEDNESGWAVMSTKTCLDADDRMKILEYVKSLGFNTNNAVDENYEMCGKFRGNTPPYFMMSPQFFPAYFNPYMNFGMGHMPKYR